MYCTFGSGNANLVQCNGSEAYERSSLDRAGRSGFGVEVREEVIAVTRKLKGFVDVAFWIEGL